MLALGFVALIVGVAAGLARLGWGLPPVAARSAALHGPLMICGFFGVVISLERAVAIGRPWAYAAPLLAGAGNLLALAGNAGAAAWPYLAAGLLLIAASLDVLRRQRELFTLTLAIAAACWPIGTALWAAGAGVHAAAGWWLAFLILTIAGERLELSRFMPPSRSARHAFTAILALILAALAAGEQRWAGAALGAGLLLLSAWLLRHDIARRTVRKTGLTRFIAVCLLSGYLWLAIGGAIVAAAGGLAPGSPAYGAAMHALGLGFVFSMVFGHAPIIFPAVLRVEVPYRRWFYLPLLLLHASLALRLAGEASGAFDWVRAGGMLNALALAGFVAGTAAAVALGARQRRAGRAPRPGGAGQP